MKPARTVFRLNCFASRPPALSRLLLSRGRALLGAALFIWGVALPSLVFGQQMLVRTGPTVTAGGGGLVNNRGQYGSNNTVTGRYHYVHQVEAPSPQTSVPAPIRMIWDEPPRFIQNGQQVTVAASVNPGNARTAVSALKEPGAHPTKILMSGTQLPGDFNDGITEGYLGYQASGPPVGSFQNYNLIQSPFYKVYNVSTSTPTVAVHVRIRGGNLSFQAATSDFVHSLTWTYVPVTAGSVSMSNLSPSPSEPVELADAAFAADVTYEANFNTGSLVLELIDAANTIRGTATQAIARTTAPQTVRMSLPSMALTPDLSGSRLRVKLLNGGSLAMEAWSLRYTIGLGLVVLKVEEDVEFLEPGGTTWETLTPGTVLREGSQLSTGPDAKVHLKFPDDSVMAVNEMTELLVNTLLRQGTAVKAQVLLKLGEVSAQVNPAKVVTSDFSVKTPVATCGVRGTILIVRHFATPQPKTLVLLTEGLADVDPDAATLPTMAVAAGQIGRVTGSAITVEPLPGLTLSRPTPGEARLSWPAPTPGMTTNAVLETSGSMSEDSWQAVNHTVSGGIASYSAALVSRSFFRLRYLLEY